MSVTPRDEQADPARLRTALDAAGIALWSWRVDTGEVTLDERGCELWGLPPTNLTLDALSARIDPPDPWLVRTSFEATRVKPDPYSLEFRVRCGDETRWIGARGLGADEGLHGRVMSAIFMNVTERRRSDEARELLAGEMSHRVKNLFAIATSLTAIASRSAATTAEMAKDLTQRLATLGRAHDLIRDSTHSGGHQTARLSDLFEVFLSAYDDRGSVGGKVHVSVASTMVGEAATTALALIIHELVTNSAKYGALSTPTGSLDVSSSEEDGVVTIVWSERGGPVVVVPTKQPGFGSGLVARTVAGQLGGSVAYDWLQAGVRITLCLSGDRLRF